MRTSIANATTPTLATRSVLIFLALCFHLHLSQHLSLSSAYTLACGLTWSLAQLVWTTSGSSVMRATCYGTPCTLAVSPLQMCVLLLLNHADSVAFGPIMHSLGVQRDEAESALLSLTAGLHPILVAEPPLVGVRIDDATEFRVNTGFAPPASGHVVVRSVQVQDESRAKDDVSAILFVPLSLSMMLDDVCI